MKNFLFLVALFLGLFAKSQKIEIPGETYPFYSILEWKGMGALLLNKDPEWVTKKINLTYVANQSTSVWQQSFNPNTKDFHYISSENARYVYFLDKLNPEAGKISLHQLNSAGNIKSTSISISSAVKKVGAFDISQLEMIDVVTTDKALVYIFRHHDSKEKKYSDIAVFITHHNLLVYAALIGDVLETTLKDPNYSHWKYIGFTEDEIYFAARDYQIKKKGWSVKNFSSKGTLTSSLFINAPEQKFSTIAHSAIGTNGRTILKGVSDSESGVLIQHAGQFYLTGVVSDGAGSIVQLKKLSEGLWADVNSAKINLESLKKTLDFATYSLNEGIGYKIGTVSLFLPFNSSARKVQGTFSTKLHTNPSRFMIEEKPEFFAVSLGTNGLLFFDTKQLNTAGNVTFELIKK